MILRFYDNAVSYIPRNSTNILTENVFIPDKNENIIESLLAKEILKIIRDRLYDKIYPISSIRGNIVDKKIHGAIGKV